MSRRGGGGLWLLAVLWLVTRKSNAPTGDVKIESASMTSGKRTQTATQAQIDYANEEPASQPE